jgi:hypothetical protein
MNNFDCYKYVLSFAFVEETGHKMIPTQTNYHNSGIDRVIFVQKVLVLFRAECPAPGEKWR